MNIAISQQKNREWVRIAISQASFYNLLKQLIATYGAKMDRNVFRVIFSI